MFMAFFKRKDYQVYFEGKYILPDKVLWSTYGSKKRLEEIHVEIFYKRKITIGMMLFKKHFPS